MKKQLRILVGETDELIDDAALTAAELAKKLDPDEESFLFVLDEDDPVEGTVVLGSLIDDGKRELIHSRCRRVKVSVTYLTDTKEHTFPPSAKVGRIKRWFCKAFGIDEASVPDMGLFFADQKDALDEHKPIQFYLEKGKCGIELELAKKEGWQG